jgi:hypothetical protein
MTARWRCSMTLNSTSMARRALCRDQHHGGVCLSGRCQASGEANVGGVGHAEARCVPGPALCRLVPIPPMPRCLGLVRTFSTSWTGENFLYVLNGAPWARRAVRPRPGSGHERGFHRESVGHVGTPTVGGWGWRESRRWWAAAQARCLCVGDARHGPPPQRRPTRATSGGPSCPPLDRWSCARSAAQCWTCSTRGCTDAATSPAPACRSPSTWSPGPAPPRYCWPYSGPPRSSHRRSREFLLAIGISSGEEGNATSGSADHS